jgi:hypothetical protein
LKYKRPLYLVSEQRFISDGFQEGGVRLCTKEYLNLLKEDFEVTILTLNYRTDLAFRVRTFLGIDVYDFYSETSFANRLNNLKTEGEVFFAFNMAQTLRLTRVVKQKYGDRAKVILLSHGNESTDFVHRFTRFKKKQSLVKQLFSSYKLGALLKAESEYRLRYIDYVFTVSPIEKEIEKWLNVKKVFFIPRTITPQFIELKPIAGRIGFIGDLSHPPNHFAVKELCQIIEKAGRTDIRFRVMGGPSDIGRKLAEEYSFVEYLGFLEENELRNEVSTWAAFLNLAFYYSQGVSTKLAKAIGLGLPIISTTHGNRGYEWTNGSLLTGRTPEEVYHLINANSFSEANIFELANQTRLIANSTPRLKEIMEAIATEM